MTDNDNERVKAKWPPRVNRFMQEHQGHRFNLTGQMQRGS